MVAPGTTIWNPSKVTLHGVSQSYPESFWRKMTSSIPRRPFALENVTLTFDSNYLYMLTGESSAGKSTILRLISGKEEPVSGNVCTSTTTTTILPTDSDQSYSHNKPIPIYLDTRPLYRDMDRISDIWGRCHDGDDTDIYQETLSDLFDLPLQSRISDLSMSQIYLCRLGEACLESCGSRSSGSVHNSFSSNRQQKMKNVEPTGGVQLLPPAPILLLDEWLDVETTSVIQSVQRALQKLVSSGGVVISVTHKPDRYEKKQLRHVILSRGKVLSQTWYS